MSDGDTLFILQLINVILTMAVTLITSLLHFRFQSRCYDKCWMDCQGKELSTDDTIETNNS